MSKSRELCHFSGTGQPVVVNSHFHWSGCLVTSHFHWPGCLVTSHSHWPGCLVTLHIQWPGCRRQFTLSLTRLSGQLTLLLTRTRVQIFTHQYFAICLDQLANVRKFQQNSRSKRFRSLPVTYIYRKPLLFQ
jgi:hypothetical protein